MKFFNGNILSLIFLSVIFFSCASKKKIVYLQDIDKSKSYENSSPYEPKLQPDDLLNIFVSSENPEVAQPFNISQFQPSSAGGNTESVRVSFLIDKSGNIDFPVIGKVMIAGLTTSEANKKLVGLISEYIKNPIVNLRILNFKISVLGEVVRPGTYSVATERVSILDALSMAGDLTIYGKRDNILVIHEQEGKKTYSRIDIRKSDFLKSPDFYLAQNDVVVVEPSRTKVNSSVIGSNTTVILSIVSIMISLSVIFIRN